MKIIINNGMKDKGWYVITDKEFNTMLKNKVIKKIKNKDNHKYGVFNKNIYVYKWVYNYENKNR